MKQETKAKLAKVKVGVKKAGRVFWGWVPILAAETAVFLGIDAYITSKKNERDINHIAKRFNKNLEIQDHNWRLCDMDHRVLVELTKDNKELLDRALNVTSGEEPEEEKKEEPAA